MAFLRVLSIYFFINISIFTNIKGTDFMVIDTIFLPPSFFLIFTVTLLIYFIITGLMFH